MTLSTQLTMVANGEAAVAADEGGVVGDVAVAAVGVVAADVEKLVAISDNCLDSHTLMLLR